MRVGTVSLLIPLLCIQAEAADAPTKLATILLPEENEIELALAAAPEHLRANATVYVFGTNGYRKVRSGTNGFTCLVNRDGNQSGDHDLKPTCWDAEGSRTIVPVMLRVGDLLATHASADAIRRDIEAGFTAGHFTSPQRTGVAYMLRGDVQFDPATGAIGKILFPPHYMIYAPGVTNADIGTAGGTSHSTHARPFVYDGYSGGSRTAYIIVPADLGSHDGSN